MFSLFKSSQPNTKEIYQELKKFYNSFFSDIYNEMNIDRYRQIRDVIGLVINKFDLSSEQEAIMKKLTESTKYVNLSYVYLSPIDSAEQFV